MKITDDGVGTVISTFEGPSTNNFSFVLHSPEVRKSQFVQIETEDGLLIGHITDITRANRYFERAESVAEYERGGQSVVAHFPTTEWEYTIANCRALGVNKDNHLFRNLFPPSPGSRVMQIDEALLKQVLGLDENGIDIGHLQSHRNVEAKINVTRMLRKHFAILAQSGAGKSHLASCLLEEILDRPKERGRIATIVLDIHGEYVGFADKRSQYSSKTTIIEGKEIRIGLSKLAPSSLEMFLPELSSKAKPILDRCFRHLKKESNDKHEAFGLQELIASVEADPAKDNVKEPLLAQLMGLRRLRLFGKTSNPSIRTLAQPGHLTILNLRDIDDFATKQALVAYFARRLFRARKDKKIPPFLFLLEEAHNFVPEKAESKRYIARYPLEKIAREGRKFDACLGLISQRPINLSQTILAQCNTHIILRVTNPNDLKRIGESSEGIDQAMLDSVTTLRVGEAILVGEATNFPIFVKIRDRKSPRIRSDEDIELEALRWESAKEKKKQDVEAFL